MSLTPSTMLPLGSKAPEFRLWEPGGSMVSLEDFQEAPALLVMFICNHCPYVKAVIDRVVADARALMAEGIGLAAICSNDATAYPADSFAAMQRFAQAHVFPFPYLHDEDQSAARTWRCLHPRFLRLRREPPAQISWSPRRRPHRAAAVRRARELVDAMRAIAATGMAPSDQVPSIGCSIKWKAAA